MRPRLSPRLLPDAVVEAIFVSTTLSVAERTAVASAAARDPVVLQATVDVLLLRVHEATDLEVVVDELARHPGVRKAYEGALAAHRAAESAPRSNPSQRLLAADPRLPCTPLGELEAVTVREAPSGRPRACAFRAPRPVLAHGPSGLLLVLGGAYRIGPRGLVG